MKALTLFAVFASSIVIAQTPPLAVTYGQGMAVAQNGQRAEFNFEVAKRAGATAGAPPVVRGRFSMGLVMPSSTGPANTGRRIHMPQAAALGVNGHVAEFGGPATMVIPTPNGPETINGRVQVRVDDQRRPDAPATTPARDHISVRFFRPSNTNPAGVMVFDYNGTVGRGDIVVRSAPTTTP